MKIPRKIRYISYATIIIALIVFNGLCFTRAFQLSKPINVKSELTDVTEEAKEESAEESSEDEESTEVEEPSEPAPQPAPSQPTPQPIANKNPYYIKINRQLNVVMVYGLDENGAYTRLLKVFVCSTGKDGGSETPTGIFSVADRYEALYLVGNVWGHYAVRIVGAIYFHSVPYFSKGAPWNNLEYEEYNKLGQGASAGCVRLSTADAEWIYTNIPYGTTVEIYNSSELPAGVIKPTPIHIDPNSENRGWDPTDPDPNNPWRVL